MLDFYTAMEEEMDCEYAHNSFVVILLHVHKCKSLFIEYPSKDNDFAFWGHT